MTVAAIGLGGNLGDPRRSMGAALDRLASAADVRLAAVASLYETPPWGKTDQPVFLNSAAAIETTGTARALLEILLAVEAELGRQRGERWGPRLVDIDILLFGEEEIDEPGLHIPHPRLAERAFALMPLTELMPDYQLAGRRLSEWLDVTDKTGIVRIAGPEWYAGEGSAESLQRKSHAALQVDADK